MNWSNINKSILVLILGAFDICLWLIWWWVCAKLPQVSQWINFQHYPTLMMVYSLSVFGYVALIVMIYLLREKPFVEKYVSYLATCYLGTTLIYGAYCIGIISPASIAGHVSLMAVGFVLFKPKELYAALVPITIFIVVSGYLSVTDQIAYAPIYSQKLQALALHRNEFWVYSMLYFYIPIFLISLALFIILLIQWKYREEHINQMSQIDPLTLVYNRRTISEFLHEKHLHQQKYIIVLLDLDHFKQINDTYGHDVGDQVLKKVAQILSENIRKGDYVGRFGGEEFVLILNCFELDQAVGLADRCRLAIERCYLEIKKAEKMYFTASFGISSPACFSREMNKEAFIRQADQALYFAKSQGRNQVRKFSELNMQNICEQIS